MASASYFKNVYATRAWKEEVDLDALFGHLKTRRQVKKTGIEQVTTNDSPTVIKQKKYKSACITPHAVFVGGRQKKHFKHFSGAFFFDIDLLDEHKGLSIERKHYMNERAWKHIEKRSVNNPLLSAICFAQESISSNGFHLFIKYSDELKSKLSLDNFETTYLGALEMLSNDARDLRGHYVIDTACKDVSRLCILAYSRVYKQGTSYTCNSIQPKEVPKVHKSYKTPSHGNLEQTIKNVLNLDSLVDIVSYLCDDAEYQVKGSEAFFLCPFHDDREPSFCVNLTEDKWFCHSCGFGGRLIGFIKRAHNLTTSKELHELMKAAMVDKNALML